MPALFMQFASRITGKIRIKKASGILGIILWLSYSFLIINA
jgi:hypothetical protein